MAINQLQLPNPIQSPQLDWSRLDAIGDTYARIRQDAAEREAIDRAIADSTARQAMPSAPAQPRQMMPNPAGAPDDLDLIAQKNGLNPIAFKRFAQIESGGDPTRVSPSGLHGGLFQLDMADYVKRGGKNIFDPNENASIAATRLRENTEALRRRLGRDPTPTELYLSHQQGLGGVAAHMAAPDRPAWQAMLSTAEGRQRGEVWAKQAVWGNIPDQLKARFGSVDNVTSAQFMDLWRERVEGAPQQQPAAPAMTRDSRQLTEDQAKRLRAIAATGPAGRRAVQELLLKQTMPKEPIKLSEGDTLLDPNTMQPLASAPGKPQAVRPGGALVQNGRVVYQAPNAPDRGETEEQKLRAQFAARQRVAESLGMKPEDPETKRFLATGQVTAADRVTPTQLKLLVDAEDENLNLGGTREMLTRALELNDKIFTGFTADLRRRIGTGLHRSIVPNEFAGQAQATEEWQKIMEPEALQTMARTLKGATTDFELRTFVKQLADPATTPETRKVIINKLLRMADRNIKLNEARMDQIRGGTYARPGGGDSINRTTTPQSSTVTREQVEAARANPEAARAEAKAAIDRGADRAAVIRRLQQLKVSTEGL